jgi:DNA-binding transcriptional LysR family regulator
MKLPDQTAAALDPDLLRAFVTIADTGSFTRAAERLLRGQSAVSLQVRRLEDRLGVRLFERTPRSLRLTGEGERLLPEARAFLALHDAIVGRAGQPEIEGSVRLGTPEDFATVHLPDVLARFAEAHPRVALEVTCDLTLNLLDRFRAGEFDIVLVKREITAPIEGVRVWREPLVWVARPGFDVSAVAALPLVVSPAPCVYRKRAVESLERTNRRWRIAYTCGSLAGALAAVRAGLGVAVLPREMAPSGFQIIDGAPLPDLRETEIALLSASSAPRAARRLAEHMVRSLEGEARVAGSQTPVATRRVPH